ncbi:MAG: DMT family transporter [Bacteriovoracia bacterium]
MATKNQNVLSLIGVVAVSFCWGIGGPLCFITTQSLPVEQAAWARCFIAFLGLTPFFISGGLKIFISLPRKAKSLLVLSGVTLGVHFYCFMAGVAHSSLATTVTLVAVEPVLILLVGWLIFKEHLKQSSILGICLCVCGIFITAVLPHILNKNFKSSSRTYGDICAVLAVLSYGIYYAFNRGFRKYNHNPTLHRSFSLASIIYLFSAISSGIVAAFAYAKGIQFQMPSLRVFGALVAVGFIPTILGHTLNQIVSRAANPVWISLMSPGETLTALLLGFVFLGQGISNFDLAGGAFILSGVFISAYSEMKS